MRDIEIMSNSNSEKLKNKIIEGSGTSSGKGTICLVNENGSLTEIGKCTGLSVGFKEEDFLEGEPISLSEKRTVTFKLKIRWDWKTCWKMKTCFMLGRNRLPRGFHGNK